MTGTRESLTQAASVGFISLGCAKNLVNTEQMMYLLSEAGFEVKGETDFADVVIVNTCGFIESAKSEAIETIIELGRAKDEGNIGKIIVAGCLPERYKNEIMVEMPEIDAVVGVGSFDDITGVVRSVLSGNKKHGKFGDIDAPVSETKRIVTTSPIWTYLKIAEGCDNRCAYCVIPDIRGRFRSRPAVNIIREAEGLATSGIRELIIVAQDITRYGLDMHGKRELAGLLVRLAGIEGIEWIRLHYLYPDEIDEELIDVVAGNDKILNYLDIPVQHVNDGVLRRMRRRGTGEEIRALIKSLRERIPGVVLRTSLITGLPGEGEAEFEELCDFLRETKIERAGIFQYSPEEGTDAALMEKPDPETAGRRAELLTDIQSRVMEDYAASRIGTEETVLIEWRDDEQYYCRSFAESPDVDGYIILRGNGAAVNEFARARITGVENGVLIGEVSSRGKGGRYEYRK